MADIRKFKDLFSNCFTDARNWVNWFFSVIVKDNDIIGISDDDDSRMLSGALLQDYAFLYNGMELPGGYISCVATRPQERGHGLASKVMSLSVRQAYRRGMALVSLIPAQRHLYDFYAHCGFSDVYYMNEERYLTGHKFEVEGREIPVDYEMMRKIESAYGCGVIHSEDQFKYILTDMSFYNGECVIGAEDSEGNPALLFARYDTENPEAAVEVKALLSQSRQAADMALRILSERLPLRSITVKREPSDNTGPMLRAAGMARIIDVKEILSALARFNKDIRTIIKVHDDIIEENNSTFCVRDGYCTVIDSVRRPDLDVDIRTLTAILFSSSAIGSIFNLPTRRPLMTMMLD